MNQTLSNFLQIIFFTAIISGGFLFHKNIQQMFLGAQNTELPTQVEMKPVVLDTVSDTIKPVVEAESVKKEGAAASSVEKQKVVTSSIPTQSKIVKESVVQEGEISFTKEKLANLKIQLLAFCIVRKNLSEEEGKKRLYEIFNNTLGTRLDSNSGFAEVGGVLLSPEVDGVIQSIDNETCVDKSPSVTGAVVSANYDADTDTLILSGSHFINNYSEISINYFIDPSSVVPSLKSEMKYIGVSDNLLKLDPVMSKFIIASDTKVEIKKYASLMFCRDVIGDVPQFENSGNKLKVGVSFNRNDSETVTKIPDVTFQIECRDLQKKIDELKK